MAEWTFYVARGIVLNNKFNPVQIEEGLKIGLMPQIMLTSDSQEPEVLSQLYEYLKDKDISGIPLKMTSYGKTPFVESNLTKIKQVIDSVAELNEKGDENIFNEIIFHAGSVHTFEEECRLRAQSRYSGYSSLDVTFTPGDYLDALESIRSSIMQISDYAERAGVGIVIDNLAQIDFAVVSSLKAEDKPFELRDDERWADTMWLPESLQTGDIGCVYDLDFLTRGKGKICMDVEDLGQSVQYSQDYNLMRISHLDDLTDEEQKILDDFGIFVREGSPVIYKHQVDSVEIIGRFDGRIPICHIGGQVDMIYEDGGIRKIGSHMPVTFGLDSNEYIKDYVLRLDQNLRRQEKLEKYLKALNDAGCRRGVLELYLGPYHVGNKWELYNELSLKNVKSITDKF